MCIRDSDKGERFFEDKPVPDTDIDDIDMNFVKGYIDKIGYSKSPMEYLLENKGFVKEKNHSFQVSTAAILLFGKNPQLYFPRARVRFIRYEGIREMCIRDRFIIIIVMIFAFIVPAFYPYSYEQQIQGANNLAPMQYSAKEMEQIAAGEKVFPHFFGTDKMGRDRCV